MIFSAFRIVFFPRVRWRSEDAGVPAFIGVLGYLFLLSLCRLVSGCQVPMNPIFGARYPPAYLLPSFFQPIQRIFLCSHPESLEEWRRDSTVAFFRDSPPRRPFSFFRNFPHPVLVSPNEPLYLRRSPVFTRRLCSSEAVAFHVGLLFHTVSSPSPVFPIFQLRVRTFFSRLRIFANSPSSY